MENLEKKNSINYEKFEKKSHKLWEKIIKKKKNARNPALFLTI